MINLTYKVLYYVRSSRDKLKHIQSWHLLFLPYLGNGFIGLSMERYKSELYILNDTKMGLLQFSFLSLLQFRPMGETPDADGEL